MRNRLGATTSPYLLQHQDNPVHWQPWDAAALAAARAEDRPILLSIGYAACHWCHVMAHESFEDPAIAALMNEHFVNIKVDREERPDLDHIYQRALALLNQQGGWPLTMFLSPDGRPFWGGTYFPPAARYGRPGLPEVLTEISRIWRTDRARATANGTALAEALAELGRPAAGPELPPDLARQTARAVVQRFDTMHGGLAGAPKFPQAPLLKLLWWQGLSSGDPALRHAIRHTLARMCQGGIYDHLGGGFARYSVDAFWLVPHFEKMLYDNAQLLGLLADLWADSQEPLFAARARETVAWLTREMLVEDGFAASLDADSEGEEGRFYVWDAAEIDGVLGADAAAFRLAYGVTDSGNWEGRTILNRLHQPGLGPPAEEAALRRSAERLLAARAARVRPARDDKVLADWNGLMIAALAKASGRFGEPAWLALAERAFAFVQQQLGDAPGRLAHSWRAGRRLELAFLDDYAALMAAALALDEAAGTARHLAQAERWFDQLEADYRDEAAGGYRQVAAGAGELLVQPKHAEDGPSPAGNGLLAEVLARLHQLTGKAIYAERAAELGRVFAGEALRHPAVHAALLCGQALLAEPLQVVVVGAADDPARARLHRAALAASPPQATIQCVAAGADLPPEHPAAGKTSAGPAAAYVCLGRTCQLPISDPAELAARLRPAMLWPQPTGSA